MPDRIKAWCRKSSSATWSISAKDPAPNSDYYDTAFVVGPTGEIIFKQGKKVPIQFFKDGLPAPSQQLWDSPWGRIGICICYDLSYTRVTDELVRLGAQAIIVPTMDVETWGRHQHELHTRVALVRAAEYGIPIFRVASSGISQLVDASGQTVASAPMPGDGAMLAGELGTCGSPDIALGSHHCTRGGRRHGADDRLAFSGRDTKQISSHSRACAGGKRGLKPT